MRNDLELVPGLRPRQYMKVRSGAEAYSLRRGHYITCRLANVRLAHYLRGVYVTPSAAINDREITRVLVEQGFDFAPLLSLRDADRNAFHNITSVELHSPKACWAGTGGYWCQTNIENVMAM